MSALIGTCLGKYPIRSMLGKGGMAEVYRAHHPTLDRPVAIKVMHAHFATRSDFLAIFTREARAVARLRHPHIVQIYDFDVFDAMPYMVMEMVDGPTLTTRIHSRAAQSTPFSLAELATFFPDLVNAVGYAHARGIIHRDLKPANVMFTAEGQVVLTDFGIAHLALAGQASHTDGYIVGTPAYMSPEQARGQAVDARSDIYALGIVLYELVVGRRPFEGTAAHIIQQQISTPLPAPGTICADVVPALEQIILRATRKQPDDRYQCADDLVQAFWDAYRAVEEPASAPASQRATRPLATLAAPATVRLELPPCPYRGLFAFREEDAPLFFGRDAVIDDLVQAVEQQAAVVVIGPSGSGKSSVVAAGLLPRLQQAAHLRQAQGTAWTIARMRPEDRPFHALAAAFLSVLQPHLSVSDRLRSVEQVAHELANGSRRVRQVAEQVAQQYPQAPHLLLVVDQFEELYTLCPDAHLRQRLLDGLLDAITPDASGNTPLTLLLTLRADFVGQVVTYRPMADLLHTSAFILGPMNRTELAQAINHPAQKLGVPFEDGLIERILDDVSNEPGSLPLLEFALTLLWEQHDSGVLTHAGYEAIGYVEGALARYADHVYSSLSPSEQTAVRRIIIQLVRPGEGTEDTRRVASLTELVAADRAVVQRLADARLVVTSRDTAGEETVEVAHEALIRGWARLQDWIQADRAFREWQERLRVALRQWESSSQDEGALLRGAPLADAEAWLHERGAEVSEQERAYIAASVALRQQELEQAQALVAEKQRRVEEQEATNVRLRLRAVYMAIALVTALVIAITLGVLVTIQSERRVQEAEQSEQEQQEKFATAETRREYFQHVAQDIQAFPLAMDAELALSQGDGDHALALASAAMRKDPSSVRAQHALIAAAYTHGAAHWIPRDQIGDVACFAFSPDGRQLLLGARDGTLELWDVDRMEKLHTLDGHTDWIMAVAFSADGDTVWSASWDRTVRQWEVEHGEETRRIPFPFHDVLGVSFSQDGKHVLVVSWMNELSVLELKHGREEFRLVSSSDNISLDFKTGLALSPDGAYAASHGWNNIIHLWDVAQGMRLRGFSGHTDYVSSIAFSPDGSQLVSGSWDGTIRLWDVASGRELLSIEGHRAVLSSVTFSPDGRLIASAAADVRLWDATNGLEVDRFAGHSGQVQQVVFAPDGKKLVSLADDGVRFWNTNPYPQLHHFKGFNGVAAFSPDGDTVLAAAVDHTLWLLDARTGTFIRSFAGHIRRVNRIAFSPDGRLAVSGCEDGTLRLWDVQTAQEQRLMVPTDTDESPGTPVTSVTFSPDGQAVLAATDQGDVQLWDVQTGDEIRSFQGLDTAVRSTTFSPDGTIIFAGTEDGTLHAWSITNGQALSTLEQDHAIMSVQVSSDTRRVLTGSSAGKLVLWERATGKKVRSFAGHTDAIQNVVFAADGRTLFSASRDGTMRFWDMQSGRELRRIAVPHLSYAALNADGRQALSTSSYGTLVLWQIDSIEAIQSWVTANRYIPELTCEQRDFYQVKPLCDEEGQLPSPTPTPPTSATATPSQRQQGGGL